MSLISLSTWLAGWMSQGGHSDAEPLLLLAFFYWSTSPSPCLKIMGWWGGGGAGGGGPCDYFVSSSPFGLDFGTLDFGNSDLSLTILD